METSEKSWTDAQCAHGDVSKKTPNGQLKAKEPDRYFLFPSQACRKRDESDFFSEKLEECHHHRRQHFCKRLFLHDVTISLAA
jgi:hypothetical protein